MSYNISNFKIRSFSLKLPERFDWGEWYDNHISLSHWKGGCMESWPQRDSFLINCGNWEIAGSIKDGHQVVEEFYGSADGTGYEWEDVFKPLFEKFGELDAIIVWENGDSIQDVKIKNGETEIQAIE